MSRINKSVFVFGLYALGMGFVLLFIPHLILPLVGILFSNEPWLFLLGFVLMCSSYYYLRSAWKGEDDFALYTIHTRFASPVLVAFLISTGKADWHFLSFGIVDGLGGLWTWIEFKRNKSVLNKTYEK